MEALPCLVVPFALAFSAACIAFYIWVIVECVTKEDSGDNTQLIWILLILFLPVLGPILYYFVRRPQRISDLGR